MTETERKTVEQIAEKTMSVIYGALARAGVDIAHMRRHYTKAIYADIRAAGLLVGAPTEEQVELEVFRARDVIDRMFGWKYLRKYGRQHESWMDRLRDGIARAIVSGQVVPAAVIPQETSEPAPSPDREKLIASARLAADHMENADARIVEEWNAGENGGSGKFTTDDLRALAALAAPLAVGADKRPEVSAQALLDVIYDPDGDSENDSVRYGYILEQLAILRGDEQ